MNTSTEEIAATTNASVMCTKAIDAGSQEFDTGYFTNESGEDKLTQVAGSALLIFKYKR
ncbi:MAG TPA: hypothetical protein VI757_14120 [Bacteroidia bacterium]|nr:hypothetical protein [Bacteroidia bacterium]